MNAMEAHELVQNPEISVEGLVSFSRLVRLFVSRGLCTGVFHGEMSMLTLFEVDVGLDDMLCCRCLLFDWTFIL